MSKSQGDLESGLTRFLNTLYACFRFMSRFLVCCQFCECPSFGQRKTNDKKVNSTTAYGDTRGEQTSGLFSFPKRYILARMTFLGFMNMYALRVNLNVAIGAMVNNHTIKQKGITAVRVSGATFFCLQKVFSRFNLLEQPSLCLVINYLSKINLFISIERRKFSVT